LEPERGRGVRDQTIQGGLVEPLAIDPRDERGEFAIVQKQAQLLLLRDSGQLGSGKGCVHEHSVSAEDRAGDHRFEEAGVVAAEQAYLVAFPNTSGRCQTRRELLSATQQEAVAHRPAMLVDHGSFVGVTRLGCAQLGGEGEAVAAERSELIDYSFRAARVQQAAARKRLNDEQQVHGSDITSR
jgi:hypothetical protein